MVHRSESSHSTSKFIIKKIIRRRARNGPSLIKVCLTTQPFLGLIRQLYITNNQTEK